MSCSIDARHASSDAPVSRHAPRDESDGVETIWTSRGDPVKIMPFRAPDQPGISGWDIVLSLIHTTWDIREPNAAADRAASVTAGHSNDQRKPWRPVKPSAQFSARTLWPLAHPLEETVRVLRLHRARDPTPAWKKTSRSVSTSVVPSGASVRR
jgi:hypothetical protein